MYSEPKRVDYLDSIRGLAALFVLMSHTVAAFVWPVTNGQILDLPFIHILVDGPAAVVMFFVLSGYVLSRPYVGPATTTPSRRLVLPAFYLRRFTRIWLPWFAVFLMSLVAKKYIFYTPPTQPPISGWLGKFWHAPLTWGDFFRQCTFTLHDSTRQLISQDWSLGVELKGSALIPLFIFLSDRKRLPWLLLLVIFFLLFVHNGHYYISFILGVLIARYEDFCPLWLQKLAWPTKIFILFFCLLLYQVLNALMGIYGPTPTASKYGWLVSAIGCGGILLVTRFTEPIQRLLKRKPLVFLGRVSYSVYLLQFIIILCLLPWFVRCLNGFGIFYQPVLFLFVLLASISVTLACSAVTFRVIEQPAINLGHWLSKKITPQRD